jgi:redox-sensitive bicupin YhaK (pirin superfamily)
MTSKFLAVREGAGVIGRDAARRPGAAARARQTRVASVLEGARCLAGVPMCHDRPSWQGVGPMIETVIERRRRDLGGLTVGRVLPYGGGRMVGPFIFFDHIGPERFEAGIPRSLDVRPHPHIGLATVTYLFDGEMMHRDSVGSQQPIRPGEVNWMTAGRGITHSERLERARREGGPLHGIQAWVALPDGDEECEPSFAHHAAGDLPLFEDRGVWCRLVAGEAFGVAAKVETRSPLFYLHWVLAPGAHASLPAHDSERAAYVAAGSVEVDGRVLEAGSMAIFTPKRAAVLRARTDSVVMALGGEPVGPRHIDWNFVSSSKQRIEQAKADWRAGRMKLPDFDHDEFVPLPERPAVPANPTS